MKLELFQLSDLRIKGEGNFHLVVLNIRTGKVFRFPKEARKEIEFIKDEEFDKIEDTRVFEISVYFKKYNVFQKFWGKDYLPKTRICLFPKQIIQLIASYLENHRSESRKAKTIITRTDYIEIQPDLTRFPNEYQFFTSGKTYCIELKPKFGILFQTESNKPLDCRNKMSRFCMMQVQKSDTKTHYCPCDLFSGDPDRMIRAIKSLIHNPQEKLRIFKDAQKINVIDKFVICKLVDHLFQPSQHISEDECLDKFCSLIIQALLYDVSEKRDLLKVPFAYSTNCQAHSWSEEIGVSKKSSNIFSGSILGKLISTSCLMNKKSEEVYAVYNKLKAFLDENNIKKTESIFDLWNEHLLPLDLPNDIIEIVRILKKYLVCLTVRDCSIMMKFKRTFVKKLTVKQSNAAILKQNDGSTILSMIDVIDVSIKPLSKVKFNFELEQELIKFFN